MIKIIQKYTPVLVVAMAIAFVPATVSLVSYKVGFNKYMEYKQNPKQELYCLLSNSTERVLVAKEKVIAFVANEKWIFTNGWSKTCRVVW